MASRCGPLPSWVIPQANARKLYRNPSYGQRAHLAVFRPLGLTANGFKVPRNWGRPQINALQAGMNAARNDRQSRPPERPPRLVTSGHQCTRGSTSQRAAKQPRRHVANHTQLNGNNIYKLTFMPPVTNPPNLPVDGTLPPTVNNSQGNPRGFWSITVYQPDATQSAAPFISQASVLNTAFSTANIPVTAVNASTDTLTVKPSAWGPLAKMTRSCSARPQRGTASRPASPTMPRPHPTRKIDPKTKATTYSFKVSTKWLQRYQTATCRFSTAASRVH